MWDVMCVLRLGVTVSSWLSPVCLHVEAVFILIKRYHGRMAGLQFAMECQQSGGEFVLLKRLPQHNGISRLLDTLGWED